MATSSARACALVSVLAGAASLAAQDCRPWASFQEQTGQRLVAAQEVGPLDVEEKDYAWGDVDNDGDVDLVVVRKTPWLLGRKRNVLFLNEGTDEGHDVDGVLVDRTIQYMSAADDGGQGFLDLTDDRDVVLTDVNLDGWLDVVTATAYGFGLPKTISHSRVYLNLGGANGVWHGFRYEENRIPDLAAAPNTNGVAAGDVDGDGFPDLYYVSFNSALEDHLLVNDGLGIFKDESAKRFQPVMLQSGYGIATEIGDVNNDGWSDIVKCESGLVEVIYNAGEGLFDTLDVASSGAHYHMTVGELNNDGLLDLVIGDDGNDRYCLNTGVEDSIAGFACQSFQYSGGGFDQGFTGNTLVADLDDDGLDDVLIADVDVDADGCQRRTHVFRNLGDGPVPTLIEEQIGDEVVGIPIDLLTGTHDIAAMDINGDGLLDLVLGRCTGTSVWIQQPCPGCPSDLDGSGVTDVEDLVTLLLAWGTDDAAADLDGDGVVAVGDLVLLLLAWGPC